MAQKARKSRDPGDFEVARRIGNDDDDLVADGVSIQMDPFGGASFMPVRLRNANSSQKRLMREIQECVRTHISQLARLDELVASAREAGLSWESIGWLTGISGPGARKRWGDGE